MIKQNITYGELYSLLSQSLNDYPELRDKTVQGSYDNGNPENEFSAYLGIIDENDKHYPEELGEPGVILFILIKTNDK